MPTCTCGKDFEAKRADARYCSTACRVTAHRTTPVTDSRYNASVTANAVTDKAEAERLAALQLAERGEVSWSFNGKPVKIPGPYIPTPESEHRARQILSLRRSAARLEYP